MSNQETSAKDKTIQDLQKLLENAQNEKEKAKQEQRKLKEQFASLMAISAEDNYKRIFTILSSVFSLLALGTIACLYYFLINNIDINKINTDIIPILKDAISNSDSGLNIGSLFAVYISYYTIPLILLFVFLFCSLIVYILLNQAGAIGQTAIPIEDRALLQTLYQMSDKGEETVKQYIDLTRLSGLTGFFAKINITGLPLATIFLTLIFGVLGIISINQGQDQTISTKLFDFANLTLGAFLGSYVQRQTDDKTSKNEINNLSELREPPPQFNIEGNYYQADDIRLETRHDYGRDLSNQ